MKWIDISDLELWASKPTSKDNLPLLISRLIRATTTTITNLDIPKGKSIYRGGWDGIVVSPTETEFVPEGISLWEFGTTANAEGKANEDFKKRVENARGYNPAESTFIFVTPIAWEKSEEWILEKKKEGIWKDIKVCAGNKLIEWLSIAPIQSYWLAKEIGKAPNDGVEAAEDFWDNWKTGPEYVLLPQVITTGREDHIKNLLSALQGPPGMISIQASSRDEAIAFSIASILQFEPDLQENVLSRCVVVEDENSFKTLVTNNDQLIIIAKLGTSNALHRGVAKGHFIILPLGPDEQFTAGVNLELPRLDRDGFVNALVSSGLSKEKSQSLSKESSRNITILRRIARFDLNMPEWAKPANIRDIIPAMLLGKWDEAKERDKDLLSIIANEQYDSYITKLARWKHSQDTPIYQIGTKWRISSPLDIWSHIGKYITSADLDRFKKAFFKGIEYIKPMFDLQPEQRYMASLYGKESEYSGWLREGIVQSLIIIGVYGDEFKLTTIYGAQSWVDGLIYTLLNNLDDSLWRSLNDVMPLLAEASPTSFLTGVENSLSGEQPVISAIFEEADNIILPSSYHTGLLWALESLAWLPEYLSRVSIILAKLAILDPGGKLSNRPINSLIHIFLPWLPQTFATLDQRLQTLQMLAKNHNEIAWKLFLNLLPDHHGVAFPTNKCRWRKYNYTEPETVTYDELFKSYSKDIDLCLSLIKFDDKKISVILEKSDALPTEDRNKLFDYIKTNRDKIRDTKQKIWTQLRKTLGRHRSYPTAYWALSEDELTPYNELYETFTPTNVVNANKWLLQEDWPVFVDGKEFDIQDKEGKLTKRRIAALRSIEREISLKGIVEMLPELAPYIVGDTLGRLIESEEKLFEVFNLLKADEKSKTDCLNSVLFRLYFIKGFHWIKNLYQKAIAEKDCTIVLANVIIPLPQTKEVWDFITTTNIEVQKLYWSRFNPSLGDQDKNYIELSIQKLIEVDRNGIAIRQLGLWVSDISTDVICGTLEFVALSNSKNNTHFDNYTITRIFDELDKRSGLEVARMAKLEMYYLANLTSYGSLRTPKLIHKELSTNPISFVEILKWVYKANNDEQNEAEQKERENNPSLPIAGFHLLESWEIIPGTDENGNIDYEYLENWIAEVRELSDQIGRIEVAEGEIGKILACFKSDSDTIWPSDGICKIIDSINTKSIRNNFRTAIINSRGLTSRGVFDGGHQERNRAYYLIILA